MCLGIVMGCSEAHCFYDRDVAVAAHQKIPMCLAIVMEVCEARRLHDRDVA